MTASVLARLASAIVLLYPLLAEGANAPTGQAPQIAYPGSLLYLSRGGIWQMNLATLQRQPFLDVPNATVTHVSHSWDHQRIAYSTSVRGAGFELLESRIVVAGADGSISWSPDGRYLASWGRLGLQIVDATSESSTGYAVQWLTALSSGGPISWGH